MMTQTERVLKDEITSLKSQLLAVKQENEKLNECVQKTEINKVSL